LSLGSAGPRGTIRHSIKTFGLKEGKVSRGQFEARVRELVADDPLIAGLTDSCRSGHALGAPVAIPRCQRADYECA
jgi:hypothetical protein